MQRMTKKVVNPALWILGRTFLMLLTVDPAMAQVSGGLSQASTTATQLKTYLWVLIPIVCVIAGGILGMLYSLDIIRKDTFYQWCGGVVIAGLLAAGIVDLVFGTSI